MSGVLELRPESIQDADLEGVSRALFTQTAPKAPRVPRLIGPDGIEIELPETIHALLVTIVENLRAGNGVSVIPIHAELTTVEAAQLLNVSRPFLIKQIELGVLPHHMVGTHRRLKLADVLDYRDRLDTQASKALDAMTAEAEELGLYNE